MTSFFLSFCLGCWGLEMGWHQMRRQWWRSPPTQPPLTLSQGTHEATTFTEYWCLKSSFSYDNMGSFLQCSISLQTRHARRFWFWGFEGCESSCCTIQLWAGIHKHQRRKHSLAIAAISGMINDKWLEINSCSFDTCECLTIHTFFPF